ncbi:MAG: hypothetical protein HN757_05220 [Calditrichaeota bacterium]|nr:hypothetical protein [Calditrichota bacterium]
MIRLNRISIEHSVYVLLVIMLLLMTFSDAECESSFSALGHGWMEGTSSARSAGMGQLGLTLPDTVCLNITNPAMWSGSATARLGLQGDVYRTYIDDNTGTDVSDQFGFTGIAMAIPIGKTFFGVSLSSFTRLNYKWESTDIAAGDWSSTKESFDGRGGLTLGNVGFSFPYGERWRFGISGRAILGKTEQSWKIDFPDIASNNATRAFSDRYVGGGVSLSCHWNNQQNWSAGAMLISPISVFVERQELVKSEYTVLFDSTWDVDNNYELPIGIAFGLAKRISRDKFGAEVSWYGWDMVEEPTLLTKDFANALKISTGWEHSPEYQPYYPLWEKLTWRGGLYMQQHYSKGNTDHQALNYAMTFGFGLPYNDGKSRVDAAFEFGLRGSKDDDGAAERYAGITLSINHSDLWFVQRRKQH